MEIITNKNINLLKDELNCYDKAIIIGKGPTFQNVIRKEKELICAVNNSINFLDECDMLTINDIETVIKINQEKIKKLKYLIIPTYPHKNCKFNLQSTYHIILESFKINFNGKVLLYNLVTTPLKNCCVQRISCILFCTNLSSKLLMPSVLVAPLLPSFGICTSRTGPGR